MEEKSNLPQAGFSAVGRIFKSILLFLYKKG